MTDPLAALRAALMRRVNDGFCKYDASIVTEVLDQFATLDTARDAVPLTAEEWSRQSAAAMRAAAERMSTARDAVPDLDVERLARAMDAAEDANLEAGSYVGLDLRMSDLAEAVAVAYRAALTTKDSDAG